MNEQQVWQTVFALGVLILMGAGLSVAAFIGQKHRRS